MVSFYWFVLDGFGCSRNDLVQLDFYENIS